MKVTVDCIPCYLVQTKNALLQAGVSEETQFQLINQLLPMIPYLDNNNTPAENSTIILHKLVELLGGIDPYKDAKAKSNKLATSHYTKLAEIISKADDPLYTALKISVAGNVIDLGIFQEYDIDAAINDALAINFSIDSYHDFFELLGKSDSVMIIGDNSGEIVFDKLLLQELKKNANNLVYGVKGGFVINDATIDDAIEVEIENLAKVITNGNNFLGTIEGKCSQEFLEAMDNAEIIISKGQANYETLEGTKLADKKTFFLLKAKCPVVAKNLGAEYGDIVFVKNLLKEF